MKQTRIFTGSYSILKMIIITLYHAIAVYHASGQFWMHIICPCMQANNELAAIIAISYSYSMGHGIYGSKPTQVQLPD